MQKVLVAGGAGFIGSHLCKSLLDKGYSVVCIDNLITGSKTNLKEVSENPHFTFIQQDITHLILSNSDRLVNLKYIFHLASPASPNKKSHLSYINHPIETLLVNSIGTYNLLELTKEKNAKFLFVSSSEIYGDPTISPQSEQYFGNVNPNGPRSVYDEAKRFGESMTMAYVRKYRVDARIVRIFNTYGPNMQKEDGRVVSNFISQAISNSPITVYGNGTQSRSFCYVTDMIKGLELAMFEDSAKGQVINIGNPQEQTIMQLATMVKTLTKSTSQIVFEDLPEDDPKQRKPDIAKAKDLLSWMPSVTIEEGLQKTIEYFKSL